MTISLKHNFHSLKGDGTDPTKVQPSNWNEEHVLTQASGYVLGRATVGTGNTEEIPWTAFGRAFINLADASAALGVLGPVSNLANQSVTYKKLQLASAAAKLLGSNGNAALTITGASNNGSGLIRLQVASTSTFATGQRKVVAGVVGTVEANDSWIITVVDATHIDLQGSTFANAYISGGTIGAGFEEITLGANLRMSGSTLLISAPPVAGSYRKKVIKVTGNTGCSVSVASVVCTDGAGNFNTVSISSTVNLATNGGIDAMEGALTLAGPAWLSLWAICKADGSSPKVLANYSDTTITTMPTDYTQKALLGHLRVASSNLLHGIWLFDDEAQYIVGLAQTTITRNMATGTSGGTYSLTSPTLVAIDTTGFVPPTASKIHCMIGNQWAGLGQSNIIVAPSMAYSGVNKGPLGTDGLVPAYWNNAASGNNGGAFISMLLESGNIYWVSNNAGGVVACLGYKESI